MKSGGGYWKLVVRGLCDFINFEKSRHAFARHLWISQVMFSISLLAGKGGKGQQ